jgi:hypothetical protein
LQGTGLSTVTDANGEFHFDNFTPNQDYIVQVDGGEFVLLCVGLTDPSISGDLVFSCTFVPEVPRPQVTDVWDQR